MKARPYAVSLALAAIVAVAGCTGDSTPTQIGSTTQPAASTSAPSSPTTPSGAATTPSGQATSTGVTDPNLPAAAKAQTTEGATALTGYFFTLLNQAWTRPQAGLMSRHFTSACLTCQNFEKNANEYVAKNQRYDRPPVEVRRCLVTALLSRGQPR